MLKDLPGLQHRKDAFGKQVTLRDLASSRIGLIAESLYWGIMTDDRLLDRSYFVSLVVHLQASQPFPESRRSWLPRIARSFPAT